MCLSATKQPSTSGADCVLSPTAEGRVKKIIIIMCSLFSPNCASAPWLCCHRHNHWLLEAEAKPTQGNNDWQVTHSQVTVTNITNISSGRWVFNVHFNVWFCDSF